ncbi:unannotated protein [freshwater metagenome]|uniref:Unannotated protein n=2 Tax=freshwater metagenome TaxID=449393 RepID=A0A6J7DVJ0_9ZZZZ|nr:DUF3145 family protein [Actinomycetota bacterium]
MDRMKPPGNRGPITMSRGTLVIHSAPSALTCHIQWAIENLLGKGAQLQWRPQPLLAGTQRASLEWRDCEGIGAELASVLRGWHYLRFEIQEESAHERNLYRFTPNLGMHRAVIDASGSVLVTENQITHALAMNEEALRSALEDVLGNDWDRELEQFRCVELDAISHSRAI